MACRRECSSLTRNPAGWIPARIRRLSAGVGRRDPIKFFGHFIYQTSLVFSQTRLETERELESFNRDFHDFTAILKRKTPKTNSYSLTPWRNGSASDSRSEGCVFKSRRDQLFAFPAANSSLSNCTVILCGKKAASITALNLLLNAISSQSGTHSCMFKTSQYQ